MRFIRLAGNHKARAAAPGLALLGCLLAGCGSEPASPAARTPAKGAGKAPAAETEAAAASPAEPRRSVFTIGQNARDPFFPDARPAAVAAVEPARTDSVSPEDVKAVLAAGFQGVMATSDKRMALIYNTVLEPRKSAQVVARISGREYRFSLRCLDVARDSVTVQIDGQPFPITISGPVKGSL